MTASIMTKAFALVIIFYGINQNLSDDLVFDSHVKHGDWFYCG